MGSRALVARRRANGFALAYSQWGGRGAGLPAVTEPLADGLSWSEVLDRVDCVLHEALWRVDGTGAVRYVPCALALDPTRGDAGEGGLLIRARDDAAVVRAYYEGSRDALAGVVAGGALDEAGAVERLAAGLEDRFGDREVIAAP